MALICGIDEAGRGPILGPLVICGLMADEERQEEFRRIGVKDSKVLSAKQREALVGAIKELCSGFRMVVVEPSEIDTAVKGSVSNLNWLEADKAVQILNELRPDKAFLDCPSPNIRAFTSYVTHRLSHKCSLLCAHHADREYPVVSAASILAKVERDRLIERIKADIGIDFGSGYGHDPATVEFVEKCWNTHSFLFRRSWKNYRHQAEKSKQDTLEKFQ